MSTHPSYVHGYHDHEQDRLYRQAAFLESAIHDSLNLTHARHLLEIGCGVGAQTEILLRRNPRLHVTGIDISQPQIERARAHFETLPHLTPRARFQQANAAELDPATNGPFDSAFLCWLLEHVPQPAIILQRLRSTLSPGACVYVTEVMNHTFRLEPASPTVMEYWNALNRLQLDFGGDPYVGTKLGELLHRAGYKHIRLRPHLFCWDQREPAQRAAMIDYWTELTLSAAPALLQQNRIAPDLPDRVRAELQSVRDHPNGLFFYIFMQAQAEA